MRQRWTRTIGALSVVLLAVSAWAGTGELRVEVPFEFTASQEALPAGSYVIRERGQMLVIKNGKGGEGTVLNVVTRLARRPSSDGNGSNLVFDTVGGQRFLSEVWLSDGDGFLVRGTQENHEHQLVTPKN